MSMSKLVNVNSIPQLIDLNEDIVNFKLDFKVSSENNELFNAVVASQLKLDSAEPLDFKKVDNGNISGTIVADNGVKQNYYLVLKSDKPTKCTVELNLQKIPLNPKYVQEIPRNRNINTNITQNSVHSIQESHYFFTKKTILILVGIVGVIIFYYLFFIRKTGNINIVPTSSELDLPSGNNNLLSTITDDIPVISSNTIDFGGGGGGGGGGKCDNNVPIFDSLKENLLLKLNSVQLY